MLNFLIYAPLCFLLFLRNFKNKFMTILFSTMYNEKNFQKTDIENLPLKISCIISNRELICSKFSIQMIGLLKNHMDNCK